MGDLEHGAERVAHDGPPVDVWGVEWAFDARRSCRDGSVIGRAMISESPMRISAGRSAGTSPSAPKTARRNSTAATVSLTTMRGVTVWNPDDGGLTVLRVRSDRRSRAA
jgi:hypothetical protein